jgi:hypothetical protein
VDDDRTEEQQFDKALRAWAERPPRSSGGEAARAVAAAVTARRTHPPRLAWAMATAAALALAVSGALVLRGLRTQGAVREAGVVLSAPALADGQVLIWLDDETPLYMTFATPGNGVR